MTSILHFPLAGFEFTGSLFAAQPSDRMSSAPMISIFPSAVALPAIAGVVFYPTEIRGFQYLEPQPAMTLSLG